MSAPRVSARLWRCDYAGTRQEDVSAIVVSGTVTMNPENDQTWQLDAIVTWEGYQALDRNLDWLAPELTVEWPDGTVRQGQLGLYFVLESPVKHGERDASVQLRAMDPLWLVARQGFSDRLEIRANTSKARVVRVILDGAALTEDAQGRPRYAIPDSNERFKKDREYPRTENRLAVANEIAQGMGCYNLWSTGLGIMTTKKMGEARLRQRTPVKTYVANVPPGVELLARQLPVGGVASEVIGIIDTSPYDDSLLNEILMVNDDPDLPRINVRGRVRNRKNPRSVFRNKGRRHSRVIHNPVVDDEATAQQVADALLDELSTRNHTARLTVLPDPAVEFGRETVDLLIYNARGDEVAVGQYAVHAVSYGFTASSAVMTLDVGRIDDVEGIDGEEAA